MNSDDLSIHQYRALSDQLNPMHAYLNRLIKRMNKAKFPHDDPLWPKVLAASAALHDLTVHVHYKGCDPPKLSSLSPQDDGPKAA
jgi:hypothetical protein